MQNSICISDQKSLLFSYQIASFNPELIYIYHKKLSPSLQFLQSPSPPSCLSILVIFYCAAAALCFLKLESVNIKNPQKVSKVVKSANKMIKKIICNAPLEHPVTFKNQMSNHQPHQPLDTGCSLIIVFFSLNTRKFASSPFRQHSAAIGCTKNYQPLGVTVHSYSVESLE